MVRLKCKKCGAVFEQGVGGNNILLGLGVSAALAAADAALFYLAKATFQREEILTTWK